MATIKVTYNSISRRFNITSTNWAELESKLRSLYNIPTTSSLTVSYKDEDGDVITLSSDLELKEVLVQQSSGRPIKLILSTVNNKSENLVFEDGNDNDAKLSNVEVNNNLIEDFSSTQQNQQQTTQLEEESSNYQHVTFNEEEEEPEYEQSTPLLNKEKEKESEKQRPERTDENKAQPEKENKENDDEHDDDDDDEIIFIFSYPWNYHQTFFGSRFGFGGPRFGLFNSPGLFNGLHHPFSPFNFHGYSRFHHPAFFNGCGRSYAFCQYGPNAFGQNFNACNGNSNPFCCSKPQQSDFCNKNAEASTSTSAKINGCNKSRYNNSSRPSCGRNSNFFHPQYYNQTTFTQEQLNDKLSTLHSMGFDSSNNALYEDLLKRYNGNLERVVELLLRNQQANKYYDNEKASTSKSKKQNGIVINEEKPNNDGIKQVDNEESKPYNL